MRNEKQVSRKSQVSGNGGNVQGHLVVESRMAGDKKKGKINKAEARI